MRILHPETFFHDGRGPILLKVHLAPKSSHLLAIDFALPTAEPLELHHVRFLKSQAYLFTPEEVENYETNPVDWGATNMGALVSLGRSVWLKSFSQRHLSNCEHFKLMFYDEFLDVICEQVVIEPRPFQSN